MIQFISVATNVAEKINHTYTGCAPLNVGQDIEPLNSACL